ncbi:hypothetical protein Tco_0005085 [Tanacetum coccineum]
MLLRGGSEPGSELSRAGARGLGRSSSILFQSLLRANVVRVVVDPPLLNLTWGTTAHGCSELSRQLWDGYGVSWLLSVQCVYVDYSGIWLVWLVFGDRKPPALALVVLWFECGGFGYP